MGQRSVINRFLSSQFTLQTDLSGSAYIVRAALDTGKQSDAQTAVEEGIGGHYRQPVSLRQLRNAWCDGASL